MIGFRIFLSESASTFNDSRSSWRTTRACETREIGVQLTLGESRGSIAGLFVRDALGQTALGMVIGLAGVAVVTRVTGTSVYGVHGFDATTLLLAAALTMLTSVMACAPPLFRATSVDPMVAMRAE